MTLKHTMLIALLVLAMVISFAPKQSYTESQIAHIEYSNKISNGGVKPAITIP